MSIGTQSEMIVDAIIRNLRDRKGLGDEFDAIDEDTRYELIDQWRLIVRRILERP